MLIDVLTFKAHLAEINSQLGEAIVEKIIPLTFQRYSLVFQTRNQKTTALLVDVNSDNPHLFLTDEKLPKNQPTSFALTLEKYLIGARVLGVRQAGFDYVARLELSRIAADGAKQASALIIELCPRKANLILLDSETAKIIDVNTKVTAQKNRYRTLLKGDIYCPPPPPTKLDPYEISESDWEDKIKDNPSKHVWGINELVWPEIGPDYQRLQSLLKLENLTVNLYLINHAYQILTIDLSKYPFLESYATLNEALNDYYRRLYPQVVLNRRKQELRQLLKTYMSRLKKRLAKIEKDLLKANEMLEYQQYGDLIYANPTAQVVGNQVVLNDLYKAGTPQIMIEIDPANTLYENAQAFYERAKRARRGLSMIKQRLSQTHSEIVKVDSDINSIYQLVDHEAVAALLTVYQKHTKKVPVAPRKKAADTRAYKDILRFTRDDNYQFWLGKNQRGNERLLKLARGNDVWMHALGYPGSHVIIKTKRKNEDVPLPILLEAAALTAYYSQARRKAKVEVDYTKRKHVSKQKGKVGAVTYSQQKTLLVAPRNFSQFE